MEFIAQKGEIIVMDDESCYLVLKNLEFNNKAYLKTIKTGDYLLEEDFDIDKTSEVYLKETVENDDCFYDFIKDEAIINELKKI